jgi:hypothetical protein
MKSARHISMAVDLASASYDGIEWLLAQCTADMAIGNFVRSTEELVARWEQLPEHKRTAQRFPEQEVGLG